jgi:N-acetylglucosaminyl-diphospho-decaprenol L-rhamnosyltransferase
VLGCLAAGPVSRGSPFVTPLHVLIVNYRTAALALKAVASVMAQHDQLEGGRVLLIDNASGDGSVEQLRKGVLEAGWSDRVEVLPQPLNGGFAYGNNRGFDRLRESGDWGRAHVLLLNPDAQVMPGCLASLRRALVAHPRAGIIGAPLRDRHGEEHCSAHRLPSPLSELLSQASLGLLVRLLPAYDVSPPTGSGDTPCEWISGACFLIRAELAAQLGNMDEGYFLYFEEVDYCHRAAALGWTIVRADGPGIVHWEGSATGIGQTDRPRPAYWYDSRRRYLVKFHGRAGLLFADAMSLLGRALYLPRKWLRLGSAAGVDPVPPRYHWRMLTSDLKALLGR